MATLSTSWTLLGEDHIVSSYGDLSVRLYARYSEQDITNNRTYVIYETRAYFSGNYIISAGPTYCTISGTGISSYTTQHYDFIGSQNGYFYKGETTLQSSGGWVGHNGDGTKSVTASATFVAGPWNYAEGKISNVSASLPTIPRATPAPNITAYVEDYGSLTLEPKSSSFSHTVKLTFGGKSYYVTQSGSLTTSDASNTIRILSTATFPIKFKIPTSFYSLFTGKEAKGTIEVKTYQSDALLFATSVGTKTGSLTIKAPDKCAPSMLTKNIIDINPASVDVSGDNTYLIVGKSTARVTVTVDASGGTSDNNTTITSVTINGKSANNLTADFANITSNMFEITMSNSRGFTVTEYFSNGGKLIDYFDPTFTGFVKRVEPTTGEVKLTFNGKYYKDIINIPNSTPNTLELSYAYKKKGASDWSIPDNPVISGWSNTSAGYEGTFIFPEIYDYKSQYEIIIYYKDAFGTRNIVFTLTRGLPVFWWSEDSFNVLGDLTINNISIIDLIYPVGSIYMSTKDVNPSTYLGGTWEAWGSGRVPIGVDMTQNEFNRVEKTGGEKTHTLTENEMPRHRHIVGNYNDGGVENPEFGAFAQQGGSIGWWSNINTSYKGNSEPHNILQPYITCYMWKRTR